MSHPELNERLQELHRELHGLQELDDPESQRLLAELRRDIEAVLARSEHEEGLADRLNDMVERFERTHPTLASAMGAVADQLARMGI
ncbi:MAG TPA: DUF4404 family protein [Candidatus Limnocylindrales bacterium]|nr:DUF4404 family protein [Candidatus Limnocylindrales bacterium]